LGIHASADLSGWPLAMVLTRRAVGAEASDEPASDEPARDEARASKVALAIVGAMAVLLAWSGLVGLDTSLWHDEAYTVVTFIDRGPDSMIFGYFNTNNHLLFSLLTWATTRTFGHFEAAYRFWSVVPALAAVGVVGWWAWRRLGPVAGAAVVVL